MTDAPRAVRGTHLRTGTGAFCPGQGKARTTAPFVREKVRPVAPAGTERERSIPNALFGGKTAADRGGLPAAGSGRATTTARGEQAR
ncbi:hypothetical protein ATK30_7278 [Amycolatopsis echigonensis]|uniref:Uncharacterized protein n=1 Tax=Amycolatopsis echigonensis TaxID=2576905 RepID=A0A2N3WR57_9PSEU|nr:hypothetical protein ATK30_7278 [Amycolatopsis niigatensis]